MYIDTRGCFRALSRFAIIQILFEISKTQQGDRSVRQIAVEYVCSTVDFSRKSSSLGGTQETRQNGGSHLHERHREAHLAKAVQSASRRG